MAALAKAEARTKERDMVRALFLKFIGKCQAANIAPEITYVFLAEATVAGLIRLDMLASAGAGKPALDTGRAQEVMNKLFHHYVTQCGNEYAANVAKANNDGPRT
jgi:hypothetical protein